MKQLSPMLADNNDASEKNSMNILIKNHLRVVLLEDYFGLVKY